MPLSTRYAAPITTFRRQKEEDEEKRERERERETLYLLGLPHSTESTPLHSSLLAPLWPRIVAPILHARRCRTIFLLPPPSFWKKRRRTWPQSVRNRVQWYVLSLGGSLKRGRKFLGKRARFELERCPLVSRFPLHHSLMLAESV